MHEWGLLRESVSLRGRNGANRSKQECEMRMVTLAFRRSAIFLENRLLPPSPSLTSPPPRSRFPRHGWLVKSGRHDFALCSLEPPRLVGSRSLGKMAAERYEEANHGRDIYREV
uniref:Uncharacterized protein n=1 Tax=Vespula pensylvanica TaxID=30213 RepID=A0A834NYQ9_VESPE|nr:hypothetical protein H0235_009435 [Vespula pensylvanica]